MTQDPPAVGERYRLCTRCGYATEASRSRCQHCIRDITEAPILEPEATRRRLGLQAEIERDREEREQRRQRINRYLRIGGLALLLVLLGFWSYRTCIYEPPPVPLPSSTARTVVSTAESWPTSGGDLAGSRSTTATPLLGGRVDWTVVLGAAPATDPITDGERLYLFTNDSRLVALWLSDGSVAWEQPITVVPFAAPTLAGGVLYVATRAGQLLALDATTGEEIFASLSTGTRIGTSPLVDGGVAYLFGIGALFGFDAETGERLWETEIDSPWGFVNPVLDGQFVATATGNRSLVFDRVTGRETYFYEFERAHPYAIALDEGVVFTFSSRLGAAYEVDSRRPWWEGIRAVWEQFWIWGTAPDVPPRPALWVDPNPPNDGYPAALTATSPLVATPDGLIVAMDRLDGSGQWRVRRERIVAPPVATGGGLLVLHEHQLALYDLADGGLLGERLFPGKLLQAVVVTSGGTFVTTAAGEVIALR